MRPSGPRHRRRLAVGDHDDLPHVLALPLEHAAREPQPFARVRVVRPDAHAPELAERHFFGRVVEEHGVQRVARILVPDQIGERERDALGRREAILAVEHHAVAAVEQQHRRARALIVALRDHEVFVVDVEAGTPESLGVSRRHDSRRRRPVVAPRCRTVAAASRFIVSPNSYGARRAAGFDARSRARACRGGRRCCGRSIRADRAARDSRGSRAPCR